MWMQINQAWLNLDAREKRLVKGLAVFLVLAVMYAFVWSPIQSNKQQAQLQLANAKQEWQWLQQQIPAVEAMQSGNRNTYNANSVNSANALMALLQRSLREQNLFKDIKTLQGTDKGVKVAFDKVNATRMFRWLGFIEQSGVTPMRLNASWVEPGLVKVEMQFTVN